MENQMNWPVDRNWTCETCGSSAWWLRWGLVHGHCFCLQCGHPYSLLKNVEGGWRRTTTPRSVLRDEFVEPAKKAWDERQLRMDRLTQAEWVEFGVDPGTF